MSDTKRDSERVRVVRAENLKKKCRLNRQGCVLIAVLAGGDYNEGGIPGCGSDKALKAAQASLGLSLCKTRNQDKYNQWAAGTATNFFKRTKINITVPSKFASIQSLATAEDVPSQKVEFLAVDITELSPEDLAAYKNQKDKTKGNRPESEKPKRDKEQKDNERA
ncbi:hypothetical protein G6011_09116 [Alternaria panax]|uniref:Uncharacterized protein n=1 Tax=Alternaria panax TaxID=48097 RepID=A0AAD4IAF7_9PLEO|nr:hypothetical protein G6011_09116 [Alternaria panax]